MKKRMCICLAVLMLILCCGCGQTDKAQQTDPVLPEEPLLTETTPTDTEPTTPETKGTLFLSVSQITFTKAGETENIYLGTAPADQVEWSSDDESIVSVKNGVLTANGTGTTTIHARLGEQEMSCEAGCLASSLEELNALSYKVLNQPKRLPPESDYDPVPFFQKTAIVGDSITMIFGQHEMKCNLLGHPLYLARGGTSINGYIKQYKEIFYKGEETHLGDAIADSGVERIFIMLGQNDLGYMSVEETLANYHILIDRIREKSPNLVIFLQTCTAEVAENGAETDKLYEFNRRLVDFAEEYDLHLVDMAIYAEDHYGNLVPSYCADLGIHLNEKGCRVWAKVLSLYAERYECELEEQK